ncbi:metallophosphoesterase family protein [Candidatus Lokiarchaeum ossiferum]|uniref:metallophosphoesterase family protein n=1 Tax=Candidatus Lokiarchaeum ossiferum TaxID=2951803 RepID=UPI00352DEC0F
MSRSNEFSEENHLRDLLYSLAKQEVPEYVFQWFFRYFAKGTEFFKAEPHDLLENYSALLSTAKIMLDHRYNNGSYSKIIHDTHTPDWNYYFIGDTHGSFDDTYLMIDYFIRVFQVNPNIKIIWLGDYVDRNPFDLQNLAFIVAFWILFPNNVFLLRGNHEDASVCSRYGFSQHLYEKAGSKDYFNPIWDQVNQFFSHLPLGFRTQIGEKKILAVHGGIPFDTKDYKPIKLEQGGSNLNCFQTEHFDMDVFSQTILWADPDPINLTTGVAPTPRTGRPRFSYQAFNDFMQLNQFDILIRGHEKFSNGYSLLWDKRLISLFSTSTYDGRKIGEAKFLRIQPSTRREDIENEELNQGIGILAIKEYFLENQLDKYYNAKTEF